MHRMPLFLPLLRMIPRHRRTFIHSHRLVNSFLYPSPDTQRGEFAIVFLRIDTIGQKHKNEMVFRIYPYAGAGKPGMTKGLWRSRETGIGFLTLGIILFRLVKPKPA